MPNTPRKPMPKRSLLEIIAEVDPEYFERKDVPAYEFTGRTFTEREGYPAGYDNGNTNTSS